MGLNFFCEKLKALMPVSTCLSRQRVAEANVAKGMITFTNCVDCEEGRKMRDGVRAMDAGEKPKTVRGTCGNCTRKNITIKKGGLCGSCSHAAGNLRGEAREQALAMIRRRIENKVMLHGDYSRRKKVVPPSQKENTSTAPPKSTPRRGVIQIHFLGNHLKIYDALVRQAEEDVRPIDKHALWILKQFVENNAACE